MTIEKKQLREIVVNLEMLAGPFGRKAQTMTSTPTGGAERQSFLLLPYLKAAFGAFAAAALASSVQPAHAANFTFQDIINTKDVTFNQALGINVGGTIAGYFGIGSAAHPNQGYTVVPPYNTPANFTGENFPGSVQTQVVGINNAGVTVGFYIDAAGVNHGFDKIGNTFTTVDNPLTTSTPAFNQLAGVNNANLAAGFYMTADTNLHGYIAALGPTPTFTPINVAGASSVSATGINTSDLVSGFFVDTLQATHSVSWRMKTAAASKHSRFRDQRSRSSSG